MNSKGITESGTAWIKFGTGHFIQWGKATNGATVTFPKPFSAVPKVIVGQSDGGSNQTNTGCTSKTTTSFTNVRYGCDWVALGK